jgi:hypothetical protein
MKKWQRNVLIIISVAAVCGLVWVLVGAVRSLFYMM